MYHQKTEIYKIDFYRKLILGVNSMWLIKLIIMFKIPWTIKIVSNSYINIWVNVYSHYVWWIWTCDLDQEKIITMQYILNMCSILENCKCRDEVSLQDISVKCTPEKMSIRLYLVHNKFSRQNSDDRNLPCFAKLVTPISL